MDFHQEKGAPAKVYGARKKQHQAKRLAMGQGRGEICLRASELRRVVGLRRQRHCVEKHEPQKTRYSWETSSSISSMMSCPATSLRIVDHEVKRAFSVICLEIADNPGRNKHVSAINEVSRPL